ncbi:NAD(P)-dependent oxidoreductase [Ktedonosporobacter rubrisoli]|uniref:NAD(P)-dependent oxidoreductase n=1 Tax=Ktedonosporobacter rubrisoli TaxID=2509675 RepID=A0A4P6JRN1_KTERU|nr:NAD(P)-dependent oxidoreductase [Ktedonosporobacter rubrisoli]QBD78129.1 NAD(P)-dependent oxidoreductase [Ktedonosporobacter rubrisoli]
MNIFVTGATGVLGKPVVKLLVEAGHHVFALSRSERNAMLIQQLGAEPVSADLFSADSMRQVLETTKANAIVHLATKIPPTMQMGKLASWQENDHIRRDGTRALVDAALEACVQTFVYPSFYYVYPDRGAQWIDALSTPVQSHPTQQATLDAEAEVERFSGEQRRGIVLRMGSLYGPEAPSALEQWNFAQKGLAVLPGARDAYLSYVWVEDAACAIVIALAEAPSGIYDIVDDEPLTRQAFADALANSVGKRRLFFIPNMLMKMMSGIAANLINRSQRVSNRRFKELTSWKPEFPNAREGWMRLAQAKRLLEVAS